MEQIYAKVSEISDTAFDLFMGEGDTDLLIDSSEIDIDQITLGKISYSTNNGEIYGDINIGGITGAMAMEYALDPEDDITGDMNAKERRKYEIKAEGCYGTWDVEELENLTFDINVPYTTALESVKTRENGRPVFYSEGQYRSDDRLQVESLSAEDANLTMIPSGFWDVVKKMFTSGSMHWKCLEHWQVIMPNDGPHCLRYLPLQEDGRMAVFLRQDGVWEEAVTESVGSYLAFRTEGAQVEVAVVTEMPVWWVWVLLAALAAALIALIVVRRKKRPMPGKKDGDGADRSKEPDGSKNKGKRLTVLAVILLAALLIGAVTVFAFRSGAVTDMRAYRLLQDLAWDEEFSVALQVDGDYDGQEFEVSAQIHRMQVEGQAVTLVSRNGNDFYYCGDVLVLENGKAYQIQGENRGSDELLDQTLELYRNFEIREEEGNFFITASGDHAAR